MLLDGKLARSLGMARSLLMYRSRPWRNGRREKFYAQFLSPRSLAFDIGSHVGDRVATWRALGARVVAVEPQSDFAAFLDRVYGSDDDVTILRCAVGAPTEPPRCT